MPPDASGSSRTASGAAAERPGLAACLDHLRRHDVLVVLDLDRLGRLAHNLVALIDGLEKRGISFKALNSPMDTTTPAGRAFLQVQAAFAEMERNLTRQRVKEGILAARARGRNGGRPRIMTIDKLRYAQHLMADRSRSIPAICRELGGIPSSTLYHYLHADGALKEPGRKLLNRSLTARVAFRTFVGKNPMQGKRMCSPAPANPVQPSMGACRGAGRPSQPANIGSTMVGRGRRTGRPRPDAGVV